MGGPSQLIDRYRRKYLMTTPLVEMAGKPPIQECGQVGWGPRAFPALAIPTKDWQKLKVTPNPKIHS